jgi:hypothetical protein
MKRMKCLFTIAGIVVGLMMPVKTAFADPDKLPPGQFPAFAAQWWQWALSIPTSVNPLLDTTGENCMVGQRDFVWFLGGVNGGGSATRTCSVPDDKTLFFPVVNSVNANSPNVCGQDATNLSVKELRDSVKPGIDGARNISVQVDGIAVKKNLLRREQSQVFDVALPEDNLFDKPCTDLGLGNVPAGIYSPAVDDGYYVALSPLKAGSHILHFHADNKDGTVAQDVTYHLEVEAVSLK